MAHLELGLIHERRGEMPTAEEHYMEALRGDPENPRVLYSYASLYYATDDFETAEEFLKRALSLDPEYFPALSALASIRARSGDYEPALRYVEEAVAAGESDAGHFKSALEFVPLRNDPRFQTLLSRMASRNERDPGQ